MTRSPSSAATETRRRATKSACSFQWRTCSRGTAADERTLVGLLDTLSRDDTLFHAAHLNIIMTGPGDYAMRPRQEQAMQMLCAPEQWDRINAFARRHKAAGVPSVFFRGQLLELMRWTARHARNPLNDGTAFDERAFRERLLKAALIAGSCGDSGPMAGSLQTRLRSRMRDFAH